MGLPAVKEFGEPSTQLEFDKFDKSGVDDGKFEGKVSGQPPAEDVDGGDEGDEEDEVSESPPKKKTKPPTVDEYQWQWKVRHFSYSLHRGVLTRCHSLSLKPPDVHSFCSLCSSLLSFLCRPVDNFHLRLEKTGESRGVGGKPLSDHSDDRIRFEAPSRLRLLRVPELVPPFLSSVARDPHTKTFGEQARHCLACLFEIVS